MTQEAGVPADFWGRIQKMIDDAVARLGRSGMLRNASISGGGLTIKGGFLRLRNALDTFNTFYVGPLNPTQPDGTPQQGWLVRRADGTTVLMLRDAVPQDGAGGVNQALTWFDRTGHVVISDDTDSGFGHARPFIPGAGYPAQPRHWPSTTSTTDFETLYRVRMPKQQPRLFVQAWGTNDTAGATGELRVMVNGVQFGTTKTTVSGTVQEFVFGPDVVAGAYDQALNVELQARCSGGTGAVQACFSWVQGEQS